MNPSKPTRPDAPPTSVKATLWYLNNSDEPESYEFTSASAKMLKDNTHRIVSSCGMWIDNDKTWIPAHRILRITLED
jgi:hypothetical protein